MRERGRGVDLAQIRAELPVVDNLRWKAKWRIDKFHDPTGAIAYHGRRGESIDRLIALAPNCYEGRFEQEGNLLLNVGINSIWGLITALNSQTAYSHAAAYLGVGDSATAPTDATKDALQGTQAFVAMDTSYPTAAGSEVAVWRATYGAAVADFAWNEIGVASGNNPPAAGILLNRLVQVMGTKASPASWVASLTITLA